MEDHDLKLQILYLIQKGRCAITQDWHPLNHHKWDFHHAGLADSKRKAITTKYRELLHSLLNLQLVDHDAHMTKPMPRHWPLHIADKLERRLRADKKLSDLMNCRNLDNTFDLRETAETREYLLREAGATTDPYRDRIIELALSRRGAVA